MPSRAGWGNRTTPMVSIQSDSLEHAIYSAHDYVHPDIRPEWHVNLPSWRPFAPWTTLVGHLPGTNIEQQRNVGLESLNYRRMPAATILAGSRFNRRTWHCVSAYYLILPATNNEMATRSNLGCEDIVRCRLPDWPVLSLFKRHSLYI